MNTSAEQAQQTTAELPEAALSRRKDPKYFDQRVYEDGPKDPMFWESYYTAAQMHDHFHAGVRAGMAQSQDALGYAQRLAKSIASKEYPEVTQFEVLGDLMGVLSQIDNMTCGMTRVLQGGQQ